MDITEQVCSPDRARALKERGVAQDSFFCWYPVPDGGAGELHYHPGLRHELEEQKDIRMRDTLAAFTVAELGCMLPDGAISYRIANGEYRCTIRGADVATGGETEADARADMLLLILSVQHPTDPKPFVIEGQGRRQGQNHRHGPCRPLHQTASKNGLDHGVGHLTAFVRGKSTSIPQA